MMKCPTVSIACGKTVVTGMHRSEDTANWLRGEFRWLQVCCGIDRMCNETLQQMNDNANYSACSNEAMVVISDAALANKQAIVRW